MAVATQDSSAHTDAIVNKVAPSTGMVTLQHGTLKNINLSAMTMAYKARDASMVEQAKEGEKIKVRVGNVDGRLTIVKLIAQ
jgi:Cu/Ag efflux protein CusF